MKTFGEWLIQRKPRCPDCGESLQPELNVRNYASKTARSFMRPQCNSIWSLDMGKFSPVGVMGEKDFEPV